LSHESLSRTPQDVGHLYRGPFAPAGRLDAASCQRAGDATERLNATRLYLLDHRQYIGGKPLGSLPVGFKGTLACFP
jgi:hypothetical protein